ncbi:hypothetical protein Bbelb_051850 [Branchiostoma belcheri]|nr:hypothetical protein Bbelb_051850 [Branchiostoma belcheri]
MEKSQQELQRVRLNGKCNSAEEVALRDVAQITSIDVCVIPNLPGKVRQVYLGKARASFDDRTAVLPIIIDGMDQNKTAIPHFAQKTKKDDKHLSQNISTPGEQRRKSGNKAKRQ